MNRVQEGSPPPAPRPGGATPGPAFRHDTLKTVLPLGRDATAASRWDTEPAVCGHRRLVHHNERLDTDLAVPVCASPVAVPGVGAIVGSYDGLVRFYDRSLTKVYWQTQLGAPIYASLVADRARRRVVAVTTQGRIACLDLRGGPAWQRDLGAEIRATPTVVPEADLLVLAAFDSRCFGVDLGTGEPRFEVRLPTPWHAAHGGSAAHRDAYAGPATTPDGTVVVACAEHVLCLAPDGSLRWRYEIGHAVRSSPAVLRSVNQVAVCAVNGRCVFLDAGSGALCGRLDLGGKVVASPAVSGDVLATGAQDGTAFGIDVRRHAVAWSAAGYGPREYTSFALLPDGGFTAVSARGNAVGLGRDGRFRWETSQVLGLSDHDPAMDVTPTVAPDGSMYCGSYSGMLYHFRFRPVANEEGHA